MNRDTARFAILHDRNLAATTKQYVDTLTLIHLVRVGAVSTTLNNAVANGAVLQFDTVYSDTDGYAPTTMPFSQITIPAGLGGIYILVVWSSSTGTQATTIGMGILINSTQAFSETNQSITGPASVNYTMDNGAVEIGRFADGDTLQLRNNSVSTGANVFTSVTLSLARIGPSDVPTALETMEQRIEALEHRIARVVEIE